ncbi:MAG: PEGA domain protein [Methanoregulaceae archaeon PtaB.Bin009]|jgi:hypothetical protein|nr:MAG: PEGA domain protein [Methanoregulaceae archaeon PtaB.Bin009]HNQ29293.1 PEGA domain-containing protein [Methanolinea sp.]
MRQRTFTTVIISLTILALSCSALCGACAGGSITATIGDSIPLNGTVQLADTVYLFVTGPGMPPNGARMENSNAAVITGDPDTFTQVMVENDRWAYTWNTGRVSGGLAPGSHTVFVSTQPAAANALSGVNYAEIEVILHAAVTTATLEVESSPADAAIYLNGKYSGNSPRVFRDLAPGEYAIRLEKQGYTDETGSVTLAAGDDVKFTRTLSPEGTPDTTVATLPATFPKVGETPPPAPTTTPLTSACIAGTLVLAGLFFRKPD